MSRLHHQLNRAKWAATRLLVFDAAGWRCSRCGKAGQLEAHHVRALERGGAEFELSNLICVCRSCHQAGHAKPVSDAVLRWRELVDSI